MTSIREKEHIDYLCSWQFILDIEAGRVTPGSVRQSYCLLFNYGVVDHGNHIARTLCEAHIKQLLDKWCESLMFYFGYIR